MVKNCFKTKDDKIFFVEIDTQREDEGIGAIGHPGEWQTLCTLKS